jgi:hypothetical protein
MQITLATDSPGCLVHLGTSFKTGRSHLLYGVSHSPLSLIGLRRHTSLKLDPVESELLDVLLELFGAHKLLHASLAHALPVENLEQFLELG